MDWRNLLSGVAAGGLSTFLLHPIDLIKVRFQNDAGSDFRTRSFLSTFRIIGELKSAHGMSALYQGLSANMIGSMSSWGMYFLLYEWLKEKETFRHNYFVSSAVAGVVTQLLTNPIWMAKTRLCLQAPNVRQYDGLVDCLRKVYRLEGISGIYRGLIPGIIGVSHGAVQFTAYEYLKKRTRGMFKREHDVPFYLFCSSLSKVVAVTLTYPYQVFRTRVQSGHSTLRSVLRSFVCEEGILGAYKGLGPSILRVLPATCITFVTYELLNRRMKRVNR